MQLTCTKWGLLTHGRRIQGLGRLPSGAAEPGHSDCLSQRLAAPGGRLRSLALTTLACWARKGPREETVKPRLASVPMLWALACPFASQGGVLPLCSLGGKGRGQGWPGTAPEWVGWQCCLCIRENGPQLLTRQRGWVVVVGGGGGGVGVGGLVSAGHTGHSPTPHAYLP